MSLAWFLPLPGSYAGVDVVGVYNFACSLREVLAKHPFLPHGCGLFSGSYFPSFSEGLSLRACLFRYRSGFAHYFPSFLEGLSLRVRFAEHALTSQRRFPFLFGGAFIEARLSPSRPCIGARFPFLLGGLSLRCRHCYRVTPVACAISLPIWRDFQRGPTTGSADRSQEHISPPSGGDFE